VKIIPIKLKNNPHEVFFGNAITKNLIKIINDKKLHSSFFIIIDANVEKFFGTEIRRIFSKHESKKYYYSFKSSEISKSFLELKNIYSSMLNQKFGRDTLMIAIGGGITGDLAGFAASTFMRGVQLVHVPTTLTACVDSAIGGKTAINFNYYKNMIGTFYQPNFVLCDPNFLTTLPKSELVSGIGEIIKYAFTTNKKFYKIVNNNLDKLLNHDSKVLNEVIVESILFKASVVEQDEKELGLRKVLNFGHTFAHSFERELKHKIKHGEAVNVGILCALYLSYKKNLITSSQLKKYKELPLKLKLNRSLEKVDVEKIYQNMFRDKKNRNQKVNFVLLRDIGEVILDVRAEKGEVISAINEAINSFS
jgi:3-dehydroquinate synthase